MFADRVGVSERDYCNKLDSRYEVCLLYHEELIEVTKKVTYETLLWEKKKDCDTFFLKR